MALIKELRCDSQTNVLTIKATLPDSTAEYTIAGRMSEVSTNTLVVVERLVGAATSFEKSEMYFDGVVLLPLPERPSGIHSWNWNTLTWEASPTDMAGYVVSRLSSELTEIDSAAERARLRYITGGAGQDATYVRKEGQAREWQANGFVGDAPSFISAEALALNKDPVQVALGIIQMADYWVNNKGPEIEATRLKWKGNVLAATGLAELSGLVAEATNALNAL